MIVASASRGQSPPIIGRRCPSEESTPLYCDLTVVWDLNCYVNIYLFSGGGHPLQLPAGLPKVCVKLEGCQRPLFRQCCGQGGWHQRGGGQPQVSEVAVFLDCL